MEKLMQNKVKITAALLLTGGIIKIVQKILKSKQQKQKLSLPIIDLNDSQAAQKIRSVCEKEGFFYLINHGISEKLVKKVFQESKNMFSLPMEEKLKFQKTNENGFKGYDSFGQENLEPQSKDIGDTKEGFQMAQHYDKGSFENLNYPYHCPNVFPNQMECSKDISKFQPTMETYLQDLKALCMKLVEKIAESLNLNKDFFSPQFTRPQTTLKCLHYSEQISDKSKGIMACGAHSDYEMITLLRTDGTPGLQILKDDQWVDVQYLEGAFIVNIGDLLQVWTNDVFKSTVHRVMNYHGKERYSVPFFFGPNYEAEIKCIDQFNTKENPAKYPAMTCGEHLVNMYNKTYKSFNESEFKKDVLQNQD